jgi:hypothetical protein
MPVIEAPVRTPERIENPTRMVHVAYDDTPRVALCGAPLRGVSAPGEEVDCVVCAELDAVLP